MPNESAHSSAVRSTLQGEVRLPDLFTVIPTATASLVQRSQATHSRGPQHVGDR